MKGPSGPSVVQDPREGSFLESSVMQDHMEYRRKVEENDLFLNNLF